MWQTRLGVGMLTSSSSLLDGLLFQDNDLREIMPRLIAKKTSATRGKRILDLGTRILHEYKVGALEYGPINTGHIK